MEAVARLRHYRGSAQKIRLVADLIRMKPVGKALATLRTTRKSCSPDLLKLVESALANAQQNESGVDADALVVAKIQVDEAGSKPQGRGSEAAREEAPGSRRGGRLRRGASPRPRESGGRACAQEGGVRREAGRAGRSRRGESRGGQG